eukprot:2927036-Pyramimonas_sp.AAC.1
MALGLADGMHEAGDPYCPGLRLTGQGGFRGQPGLQQPGQHGHHHGHLGGAMVPYQPPHQPQYQQYYQPRYQGFTGGCA